MTNTPSPETFEVVRRGYEPSQVDRHLATLKRELADSRKRTEAAERRVQSAG